MNQARANEARNNPDLASPPSAEDAESPPSQMARRHLFFGWALLLGFLTLGIVLEALHAFKIAEYLSPAHATRRLMWTLAHAHGTLLGLVNLAFAFTVGYVATARLSWAQWSSVLLRGGSLLLPSGFFLGGITFFAGDPGLGIALVPLGAFFLLSSVVFVLVALRISRSSVVLAVLLMGGESLRGQVEPDTEGDVPIAAVEATAAEMPRFQAVMATGVQDERLQSFDQLMREVVRDEKVPGASLAVVRQGKLVYARGFGFRDVDNQLPVMPTSLFRIASLSKPITAAAIMQLVERGELRLDDRIFEILQVKAYRETEESKEDPRLAEITIRHLLNHTAGWDRDQSYDPMFRSVRIAESLGVSPPALAEHVICFMKGQPLDFSPGERYAYCNLGYALLGRVIEAKTGQSYEQYVRQQVFLPLGTQRPRIGSTRNSSSFEVKYYHHSDEKGKSVFAEDLGKAVPNPYGAWCLEAMDAHGGWIASAVDLVRFSSALHSGTSGGLLSDSSVAQLFERPDGLAGQDEQGDPRDVYYGLGWQVRPLPATGGFHSWHTGSLDGTWTLLVHRDDDLHWALLLNTRKDRRTNDLMSRLDHKLHQAADAVQEWPEGDQFPIFFSAEESTR